MSVRLSQFEKTEIESNVKEYVDKVFKQHDLNGDGVITLDELKNIYSNAFTGKISPACQKQVSIFTF